MSHPDTSRFPLTTKGDAETAPPFVVLFEALIRREDLPAGFDDTGQFAFVGPLAQLVAAQTEVSVDAAGLAGGPATVADAVGGTVPRQGLDLAMNFQAIHRINSCVERRHQRCTLSGVALGHLLALHVAGDHRLLGHAADWYRQTRVECY